MLGREKLVFQRINILATHKSHRLVTAYFPGIAAYKVFVSFRVFRCLNNPCKSVKFVFDLKHYNTKISSGPVVSYAPSFISRITVPLSSASTVCHCPAGMFSATQSEAGARSIVSVTLPLSS